MKIDYDNFFFQQGKKKSRRNETEQSLAKDGWANSAFIVSFVDSDWLADWLSEWARVSEYHCARLRPRLSVILRLRNRKCLLISFSSSSKREYSSEMKNSHSCTLAHSLTVRSWWERGREGEREALSETRLSNFNIRHQFYRFLICISNKLLVQNSIFSPPRLDETRFGSYCVLWLALVTKIMIAACRPTHGVD